MRDGTAAGATAQAHAAASDTEPRTQVVPTGAFEFSAAAVAARVVFGAAPEVAVPSKIPVSCA